MKKGRPSKINETLENVAVSLAEHGHIDAQIAVIIGVSESALNEHKKRNPQFHESLKLAKKKFDNQLIENALLKRANGMTVKETKTQINPNGEKIVTVFEKELPPDPQALALFLRNRMPEEYNKERTKIDINPVEQRGLTREEAIQLLKDDPFFQKTDDKIF